jgi:hypothetical protein
MRMNDKEAFEHDENPDDRKPADGLFEVPKRALSRHVPIRFRPQTIEKAKIIAERDGVTVSSWIRGVVEREVERRMPASPQTHLSESDTTWRVVQYTNPTEEVETQNQDYDPRRAQLESV